MFYKTIKVFGVILFFYSQSLVAQKSQSVSIFKNSTGFFQISDTVNSVNGISLIPLPASVQLGTLWLTSTSAAINGLKVKEATSSVSAPFNNIRDMLLNNIGKRVRLVLAYQDPVEAVVNNILGNYALFKTKDRWITTDLNKIETIEFLDEPVVSSFQKSKELEVNWGSALPKQNYTIQYMRDSIGWIPEYLIQLQDNNTATLRLNANFVNNAIDLKNANVYFVAGVPNFRFINTLEPLSSGMDISSVFGPFANSDVKYDILSEMSNTNKSSNYGSGNKTSFADGSSAGEYYFYAVKNITLNKGQQSAIPILETSLPYRDVYSVNLSSNDFTRETINQSHEYKVFHSIEFTNNSGKPWALGSAFLTSSDNGILRPLAQNILSYTPKDGKAELRIAEASNIKVSDDEQEIKRDSNLKNKNGEFYDEVTVEGKINIENFSDKDITLNIYREISGELLKSDVPWKTVKKIDIQNPNNPKNDVNWELTVNASDRKIINYRYKIQIRKI